MKKRNAHYDTYDYPAYWKGRDYEHESEVIALQSFLQSVKKLGTIADVGGGFGRLIPYYLPKAQKIILAEPSNALIDVAKQTFKKNKSVGFVQTTVEDLPHNIKENSLDAVSMVRVMHHLSDPEASIKTLAKMLKKDGLLILEFANKIHGKALVQNVCRGDFFFSLDKTPTDRRCVENKTDETISFYNYHPDTIFNALKSANLKVKHIRSVSNIRNHFFKKHVPFKVLLEMESALQVPLAKIYFGPSIFILAQKQG